MTDEQNETPEAFFSERSPDVMAIVLQILEHERGTDLLEQVRELTYALTVAIEEQSKKVEATGARGVRMTVVIHAIVNVLARQCLIANLPTTPMYEAMALVTSNARGFYDGDKPIESGAEIQSLDMMRGAALKPPRQDA